MPRPIKLYSHTEAIEFLGCSERTYWRALSDGRLKGDLFLGRHVFSREQLEAARRLLNLNDKEN